MADATELETWLKGVGSLALKALADQSELHAATKPTVIKYILQHPEARERALESMRIEQRVLGSRDK